MKLSRLSCVRALALLAGVMVVSCSIASAQSGTFKLPVEAKWGKAVLPAGDYSYAMEQGGEKIVTIRSMEDGSSVMAVPASVSEMPFGPSQLILTRSGRDVFVTALTMGDYGMTLNFAVPKPRVTSTAAVTTKGQATLAAVSK
ncbi:MAG TPA: hypothetical protein VLV49_17230 [Terriglobales bacterium]|nr:hypothetical protein [Terriglobales bacterium]